MTTRIEIKPKTIGLSVWGVLTILTLVMFIVGTRQFTDAALLMAWCFFSWNFYAYSFDIRMWPWQFSELHGQGKGVPEWRTFWFWFTVVLYFALLATIAFAD